MPPIELHSTLRKSEKKLTYKTKIDDNALPN